MALELALRDAETRAESAELELDSLRRAPACRETGGAGRTADQLSRRRRTCGAKMVSEQFRGAREAHCSSRRKPIIQVDGTPGKLVDLSLTGAQLLTPAAMKPNRLITVTLPMGDSSIACKAKVMWSRLEPRSGQLWYRAGVSFTSTDQIALETFLATHQK